MSVLRLFLALDIPPRARETIVSIQNRFKTLDLHASWVRPGNIHLTLKFLGNTPSERIANIKKGVSEVAESTHVFKVGLDRLGVFPNFKNHRTLWIGLKNPHNNLKVVQENIDEKMEQLGFPKEEKKFNPHITLARIKQLKGEISKNFKDLKHEVESALPVEEEPFQVDSIRLIQSELTPKGSIFKLLGEFPLARDA